MDDESKDGWEGGQSLTTRLAQYPQATGTRHLATDRSLNMGSKVSSGVIKKLAPKKANAGTGACGDDDDSTTLRDMIRTMRRPTQQEERTAQHFVGEVNQKIIPTKEMKRSCKDAAGDSSSGSDDDHTSSSQSKRKRKCKGWNQLLSDEQPISCLIRKGENLDRSIRPRKQSSNKKGGHANGGDGRRKGKRALSQPTSSNHSENTHENRGKLAGTSIRKAEQMTETIDTLNSFSESLGDFDGKTKMVNGDFLPVSGCGLHTCEDPKDCQNACIAKAVLPNLDHMSDEELVYWYEEVTRKKFLRRSGEKIRGRIRRVIRAEAKRAAPVSNSNVCESSPGWRGTTSLEPQTSSPGKLVIDLQLVENNSLVCELPASITAREETFCAFNAESSLEENVEDKIAGSLPYFIEGSKGSILVEEGTPDCGFCTEEFFFVPEYKQVESTPAKDKPVAMDAVERSINSDAVSDVGFTQATANLDNGRCSSSPQRRAEGELFGKFIDAVHVESQQMPSFRLSAESAGGDVTSLGSIARDNVAAEQAGGIELGKAVDAVSSGENEEDHSVRSQTAADTSQESSESVSIFCVAGQPHPGLTNEDSTLLRIPKNNGKAGGAAPSPDENVSLTVERGSSLTPFPREGGLCTAYSRDSSWECGVVANAEPHQGVQNEVYPVSTISADPLGGLESATEEVQLRFNNNIISEKVIRSPACLSVKVDPKREDSLAKDVSRFESGVINNDSTSSPTNKASVDRINESQATTAFSGLQERNEDTIAEIPRNPETGQQVEFCSTHEAQHTAACLHQLDLIKTIVDFEQDCVSVQESSYKQSRVGPDHPCRDGTLPEACAVSLENGSQCPASTTQDATDRRHAVAQYQLGDNVVGAVEKGTAEEFKPSDGPGLRDFNPSSVAGQTLRDELGKCDSENALGFKALLAGDDTDDRVLSLEEYVAGHQVDRIAPQETGEDIPMMHDLEEVAPQQMEEGRKICSKHDLGDEFAAQHMLEDVACQRQLGGEATLQQTQVYDMETAAEKVLGPVEATEEVEEDAAAQEKGDEGASQKLTPEGATFEFHEESSSQQMIENVLSPQMEGKVASQELDVYGAEDRLEADVGPGAIEHVIIQDVEDATAQPMEEDVSLQDLEDVVTTQQMVECVGSQQVQGATVQQIRESGVAANQAERDRKKGAPPQIAGVSAPHSEEDVAVQQTEEGEAKQQWEEDIGTGHIAEVNESSLASPAATDPLVEDVSLNHLVDSPGPAAACEVEGDAPAHEVDEGAASRRFDEFAALHRGPGVGAEESGVHQAVDGSEPALVGLGQIQTSSKDNYLCGKALEDTAEYPVMLSQPRSHKSQEECCQDVLNVDQETSPAAFPVSRRITRASLELEQSLRPEEGKFAATQELPSPQAQGGESDPPDSFYNCASDWDSLAGEKCENPTFGTNEQSRLETVRLCDMTDTEFDRIDNFKYGMLQEEWQDAGKFLEEVEMPFFEMDAEYSPKKRKVRDSENDSDRAKRVAVEGLLHENVTVRRVRHAPSETVPEDNSTDDEDVPTALSKAVIEKNVATRGSAADTVTGLADQVSSLVGQQRYAKKKLDRLLQRNGSPQQSASFHKPSYPSPCCLADSSGLLLDSQQRHTDFHEPEPDVSCDPATPGEPDTCIDLLACEQLGEEESSQEFDSPLKLPRTRKTISPLSQLELIRASDSNSPSSSGSPPQNSPPFQLKRPAGHARHHGGLSELDYKSKDGFDCLEPNDVIDSHESSNGTIVSLDSSAKDTDSSDCRQGHDSRDTAEGPSWKISLALSPTSPPTQSGSICSNQNVSRQEAGRSQSICALPSKGILKTSPISPQPCKGLCKCCAQCTKLSSKAGTASDFISAQMKAFVSIAGNLLKEVQLLRTHVEANVSSHGDPSKIQETLKKSRVVEEKSEKALFQILRDSRRISKLTATKPSSLRKIVFADEAGKKLCHVKTFQSKSLLRSVLDGL